MKRNIEENKKKSKKEMKMIDKEYKAKYKGNAKVFLGNTKQNTMQTHSASWLPIHSNSMLGRES